MRCPRIKVDAQDGEAVYHVMSRVVNGERLLDPVAREVLRKQLWQVAEFAGLEVLTYAILSNHFHFLIRVPAKAPVCDAELLRRYRVLYPQPTRHQAERFEAISALLAINGPEADVWRKRQLAMMNDISPFMKLVKQRFSIWFNKRHGRFGTLWAERFKSVLVEPTGCAIQAIAAYIDLNCVRAGLAHDPKDYRFCGYAEAVAGGERSQRGLQSVMGGCLWSQCQPAYRQFLFGTGAAPREDAATLTVAQLRQAVLEGGKLGLHEVLRLRVRYFTDGAVLGSAAFVASHLAHYRLRTGRRRTLDVNPLPPVAEWEGITTLRALRGNALG